MYSIYTLYSIYTMNVLQSGYHFEHSMAGLYEGA